MDEFAQKGEGTTQIGDTLARAQDETAHELLVGSEGEKDVFEFSGSPRHVVGRQVECTDEAFESGDGFVDCGVLDLAGGQVDASPIRSEGAEGGASACPADDEFC